MTRAEIEATAEEKYRGQRMYVGTTTDREVAAYIQGRLDALPEEPDPAVIEAMAKALVREGIHLTEWVDDEAHRGRATGIARAAYAALRGAMQ